MSSNGDPFDLDAEIPPDLSQEEDTAVFSLNEIPVVPPTTPTRPFFDGGMELSPLKAIPDEPIPGWVRPLLGLSLTAGFVAYVVPAVGIFTGYFELHSLILVLCMGGIGGLLMAAAGSIDKETVIDQSFLYGSLLDPMFGVAAALSMWLAMQPGDGDGVKVLATTALVAGFGGRKWAIAASNAVGGS